METMASFNLCHRNFFKSHQIMISLTGSGCLFPVPDKAKAEMKDLEAQHISHILFMIAAIEKM